MLSGSGAGSNPELAMLVRQQIHELVSIHNIVLILAWIPALLNVGTHLQKCTLTQSC